MKKIIKNITPASFHNFIYKIRRRLKIYKSGVKCPICKSRFEIFHPYGLKQRENAQCPHCKSLERHRLLWLYLQKNKKMKKANKIRLLHFAPEELFYDVFSNKKHIEYFPVDLFPENYNYRGKVEVSRTDITQIPFEDGSFDIIICNHVLEHIVDDIKAMSELYRVLRKGGFGIFQVPVDYSRSVTYENPNITDPEERKKEFGQQDHVRWYGKDYPDRLRSVGFKVYEENFVNTYSSKEKFRYGLMENEIIYKCHI